MCKWQFMPLVSGIHILELKNTGTEKWFVPMEIRFNGIGYTAEPLYEEHNFAVSTFRSWWALILINPLDESHFSEPVPYNVLYLATTYTVPFNQPRDWLDEWPRISVFNSRWPGVCPRLPYLLTMSPSSTSPSSCLHAIIHRLDIHGHTVVSIFHSGVPILAMKFNPRPIFRQEQNKPFPITFNTPKAIW